MNQLRHNFSPAEITQLGHDLADSVRRYDAIEEKKKDQTKALGDDLKFLRREISVLAEKIRDGYEMREVTAQPDLFQEYVPSDAPLPISDKPKSRDRKQ